MTHTNQKGFRDYSVVPSTGVEGLDWPSKGGVPASYSAGGWTDGNEGFKQQTFLGASIRDFSVNGGFGDSTSQLAVSLVNDEHNTSDKTGAGYGDDPYHSGRFDLFAPPVVGSPVFFKFGKHHADIEQCWRKVYDQTYTYIEKLDQYQRPVYRTYWGSPKQTFPSLDEGSAWKPSISVIKKETTGVIKEIDGKLDTVKNDGSETATHFLDIEKTTAANEQKLQQETPQGDIDKTKNHWVNRSANYNVDSLNRGEHHFAFGGILQSYTQNRSTAGNPVYKVNVVDPREIMANTEIILKNYAGTTFNNKNLFNIYGFLEYNPTLKTRKKLDAHYNIGPKKVNPDTGRFPMLQKYVNPVTGGVSFLGDDMYRKWPTFPTPAFVFAQDLLPNEFPITGTGFSRVSNKGIPYYRVHQALRALFNYDGRMPKEYLEKGFGGHIDFRGFNYVVDFGGIPLDKIPPYYFLEFDQCNLLELAQELCDVISHDLFVSLLPVLNHPATEWIHNYNKDRVLYKRHDQMIHGIIRVDAIDRSAQPAFGSVKKYIDDLDKKGVHVENSDIGFELANVTTDKFIVGAQQTDMYYFNTNRDRDFLEVRKHKHGLPNKCAHLLAKQWTLDEALEQQVLPFYGFLGKDAVTIPRGWGAYQQIMLDTTSLNAHGVGNYYIATEMELRAASVSYQRWKEFLLQYNDVYMESTETNDPVEQQVLSNTIPPTGEVTWIPGLFGIPLPTYRKPKRHFPSISNRYSVCVPRCVFRSDRNYMGNDGLPASPCNPPYGYPLYYQRASQIGIPEAGVVKISAAKTQIITNLANLSTPANRQRYVRVHQSDWAAGYRGWLDDAPLPVQVMRGFMGDDAVITMKMTKDATAANVSLAEYIRKKQADGYALAQGNWRQTIAFIERKIDQNCDILKSVQRLGDKSIENSTMIYQFLKNVADSHMGKTFLVKIPKRCNLAYNKHIKLKDLGGASLGVGEVEYGPFGFRTQPINPEFGYYFGQGHQLEISMKRWAEVAAGETYLSSNHPYNEPPADRTYTYGALKNYYNPMSDNWEFNYTPNPAGGYFEFDLYKNTLRPGDVSLIPNQSLLPLATQHMLCPRDLTNFISEEGRLQCYVRFDNSQFLSFNGISAEDMCQEVVTKNGHLVPDVAEQLDNMGEDEFVSFDSKKRLAHLPRSLAFVKCDMDDRFYMPPRTVGVDPLATSHLTKLQLMREGGLFKVGGVHPTSPVFKDFVWGRTVKDMPNYHKPRMIYDPEDCKYKPSYSFYTHHFVPHPDNGGRDGTKVPQQDFFRSWDKILKGSIIKTEKEQQDPDHVYAIITVPGRITPTIDSRMQDGPYQLYQGYLFKHYMTMDTVKGPVPGFEKPTPPRSKPTNILGQVCASAKIDTLVSAFSAYSAAMEKLSLASPEAQIHFANPSPVYPDVVALPLMSKERCYGPWISSALDGKAAVYAGIGGNIEFEKDEEIAPWNYAGYQLMNEAGRLKAQFSNSLMLFSERGGFVYPGAPQGNSLAKSLITGGPLVTSISVAVGSQGIKTTYKMDLYTSSFGKLAKQKEVLIAQVSREKKKMRDRQNELTRKGMGKSATRGSFGPVIDRYKDVLNTANYTNSVMGELEKGESDASWTVASVQKEDWHGYAYDKAGNKRLAHGQDVGQKVVSKKSHEVNKFYNLPVDQNAMNRISQDTAGSPTNDGLAGVSMSPFHPNFPHVSYVNPASKEDHYDEQEQSQKS